MLHFTIVTGNKGKLAEYRRLLPSEVRFDNLHIDLEEIQSFDSKAIVEHKVKAAYQNVKRPVIVEDVSVGLDSLNGLPGPFIKFFEQRLGDDALFQISHQDDRATIICTIGYYDGQRLIFTEGIITGTVVSSRGDQGFGFDFCFMPDGASKTFAEMTRPEKDTLSHRAIAVKGLLQQLA